MKIGIIGAMPEEVNHLTRAIEAPRTERLGMRDYTTGTLYGRDVVTVFSRWGKVAAATTATTLIQQFDVDLVVFTGVAGAVAPELEIGDIVVASASLQHDLDVSALPGLKRFDVPLLGLSKFPVRSDLLERACQSARKFVADGLPDAIPDHLRQEFGIQTPQIVKGLIASGDRFIADPAVIDELRSALPDLRCVEMEGAAVAQVCYEHGIPMVLLRVMSDKADHSAVVDFAAFVSKIASPLTAGIVQDFVKTVA